MANNNQFNIIPYRGGKPTLNVISVTESTAKYSLDLINTDQGYIIVDLQQLTAGNQMKLSISASPAMFEETKTVHFTQVDPEEKTLEPIEIIFNALTRDDGYSIPIPYSKVMKKLIIDIEVTGVNQETILNIGADFDSGR